MVNKLADRGGVAMDVELRTARLEREVDDLLVRVGALERAASPAPVVPRAAPAARPAPAPAAARAAAQAAAEPPVEAPAPDAVGAPLRERSGLAASDSLEDLLGGRVLAWVGGLAVFVGVAFLLAIAVARGWIGQEARTLLAATGSTALLLAGVRLQERGARTDAARAMAAAGIAGLFTTAAVAARVYHLVPLLAGAGLAIGVGATATVLAIRWRSRGIAALGILGAVAAPMLAGSWADGGAVALLYVAMASAAGVLLWQRWDWLALAAFLLGTPQWLVYLAFADDGSLPLVPTLLTLVAFGLLGIAMAIGHDLRVRATTLRSQPAFLLALNAIVVALAGAALGATGLKLWLVGLAVAHVAVGAAGARFARVSHDLRLLSLAIGVVLADVAFGLVAHGPALAAGWAATSVAAAALTRRVRAGGADRRFLLGGLGGHVALTLLSAIVVADPVAVWRGDVALSLGAVSSVAALAAGCLVSARLVDARQREWRVLLDGIGLAAIALLTALTLDGPALALAWLGEAVALARIARRGSDPVASAGALGFLALASVYAGMTQAPPAALVNGLATPLQAVATVGGAAVVALAFGRWLRPLPGVPRGQLVAGGALGLLYLASALVVTPFADAAATDVALGAHQQGQLALSVFWALTGISALAVGLRRDLRALRLGAFALIGATVVKVFLLDLATLTSIYRVGSFVGLGLLLLAGALLWQRARPRRGAASSIGA
jgi:uncharacterized membrane protein